MPTGLIYALADFSERLIPNRGDADLEYIRAVLGGLKRLAEVQERNPFLTLSATITAGVWVTHRGSRKLLINPGQKFLRVEATYGNADNADELIEYFSNAVSTGRVEKTDREDFHQWRVRKEALPLVWEFVEALASPQPGEEGPVSTISHARYFSGEARESALAIFEKEGRKCPGVVGKTRAHKLASEDRIEFDHILPYSRGGSSTFSNLQILCSNCNRAKSAMAT